MLRVVASRVPSLALRLRKGAHYFQAGVHLLLAEVSKRYYTGISGLKKFYCPEKQLLISKRNYFSTFKTPMTLKTVTISYNSTRT